MILDASQRHFMFEWCMCKLFSDFVPNQCLISEQTDMNEQHMNKSKVRKSAPKNEIVMLNRGTQKTQRQDAVRLQMQ